MATISVSVCEYCSMPYFSFSSVQLEVIGNDAVVDYGDSVLVIEVWMSIGICFVTVSGPSGVANADEVIVLALSLLQ